MLAVKGIYDGKKIKPLEKIYNKPDSEVIIIFPDEKTCINQFKNARELLKGSGKGENLNKKLLKSRKMDHSFE